MKKFIVFLLASILLCSCATTFVSQTYGDISLLNLNGETIRKWDNSVIESEKTTKQTDFYTGITYTDTDKTNGIKEGGAINFRDENGIYHYVSGGIIIIDNLRAKTASLAGTSSLSVDKLVNREERYAEMKAEFLRCKAQVEENNKKLKRAGIGKSEHNALTEQNKKMKSKMSDLQDEAYELGFGERPFK